jgi:hypothetical protein
MTSADTPPDSEESNQDKRPELRQFRYPAEMITEN